MDECNRDDQDGKQSTVSCDDQHLMMQKLGNDSVEPTNVNDITDTPKNRSQSATKMVYSTQRQSAQMETFVDNFIKPKLSTECLTSRQKPNTKLTNDLTRRVSKKRTHFNIIILGEQGLGKHTFIQALVKNQINVHKNIEEKDSADTAMCGNDKIVENSYVLLREGQRIYLNIIEFPGYGMGLKTDSTLKDILEYVDGSFEQRFKMECSLDRSAAEDRNIHCCLYFISPFGHSLKPLDIVFLTTFKSKINIIPVIGKCDVFTKEELRKFKSNVLLDFQKHGIDLFEYLNSSEPIDDDIDDTREICEEIKNNIPFAITSSVNVIKTGKNAKESGREYPWGTVRTEHANVSDLQRLENIIAISHINYFKKLTKTVYYENFRTQYILERVQ